MSTERLSNCILCNSERLSDHLECIDHFVSGETFMISRCDDCGFCFTNPRPSIHESGSYYDSDEYISHSKTAKGLTNRLFHLARKYTIAQKCKLISKYAAGNRLLDYGSGTGEFLHAMDAKGWDCLGIEQHAAARAYAERSYSLRMSDESYLPGIPDASFDAISLWHVLEHIYPIHERLASFRDKLSDDGTLFVALPNMNAFDARKYGRFWAAYDVPRHIYHFNPDTAVAMMSKSGFRHIATRPMPLDAYYISILSEKYMGRRLKYFRALFNGTLSNAKAFFMHGNYSSLIYIFKKSN